MEMTELEAIAPEPAEWPETQEEAPFRCGCRACRRLRTGHRPPRGRREGDGDARLD